MGGCFARGWAFSHAHCMAPPPHLLLFSVLATSPPSPNLSSPHHFPVSKLGFLCQPGEPFPRKELSCFLLYGRAEMGTRFSQERQHSSPTNTLLFTLAFCELPFMCETVGGQVSVCVTLYTLLCHVWGQQLLPYPSLLLHWWFYYVSRWCGSASPAAMRATGQACMGGVDSSPYLL